MARKIKTVEIEAEGRDKGKVFVLTEMPASRSEEWAVRVFQGMARSKIDVSPELSRSGLAGIAVLGLHALAGLSFDDLKPLMAEMFACIQIRPNPREPKVVRDLIEDDIEEVKTRLKLRDEVFELHTGFSLAGAASLSALAPAEPAAEQPST